MGTSDPLRYSMCEILCETTNRGLRNSEQMVTEAFCQPHIERGRARVFKRSHF
jgi:hypothetical protein